MSEPVNKESLPERTPEQINTFWNSRRRITYAAVLQLYLIQVVSSFKAIPDGGQTIVTTVAYIDCAIIFCFFVNATAADIVGAIKGIRM